MQKKLANLFWQFQSDFFSSPCVLKLSLSSLFCKDRAKELMNYLLKWKCSKTNCMDEMPSLKSYGKRLVPLTPVSNLLAADFDSNRMKFKCLLVSPISYSYLVCFSQALHRKLQIQIYSFKVLFMQDEQLTARKMYCEHNNKNS